MRGHGPLRVLGRMKVNDSGDKGSFWMQDGVIRRIPGEGPNRSVGDIEDQIQGSEPHREDDDPAAEF